MNYIHSRICWILLTISILSIAGCGKTAKNESERPLLLVSLEPQRKMLEELAAPYFEVMTVLPPGSNPETFEPTVAQRMRIADCTAYFPIGFFPFEEGIANSLSSEIACYPLNQGIEYVEDTHSHGDHSHSVPDPHIWTSFRNAQTIADRMAMALAEMDPEHKDEYLSRRASMIERLDSLDTAVKQLFPAPVSFAVWHPSLSYFAKDYDLNQISVGQESKEVSVKELKRIINQACRDSVKVFFFQREFDTRQAESINSAIGSRLIPIDPLAYEWETELIRIANELSD